MVLGSGHFADAVHTEHGLADIDGRNAERRRNHRTNSRTAGNIVTHHECLERDSHPAAERLEPCAREYVARIALLRIYLKRNSFAEYRGVIRFRLLREVSWDYQFGTDHFLQASDPGRS